MNNEKNPKNKLADKIRAVTNVLVTVSRNPSVDELVAALGLTFVLGKLNKHATAVFSGRIPPAINFLQPEKTFEDNADSLRDFIISLDKEKADRLRYKVDGDMVKVFITPYKTKITQDDLKFEDGDFNVELVLALGVDQKEDLDQAIAAQGRILHSATIATLNIDAGKDVLGSISWQDAAASSYSEMVADLANLLVGKDKPLVDEPIATALLTGVVSATDQFKNEKTSPAVMTLAADLMAKGANQQLIASELSAKVEESPAATEENTLDLDKSETPEVPKPPATPGEISIGHGEEKTGELSHREVEFTPNAEPAASVSTEADRLNSRRDRYATDRGEDALAVAQARLDEARNSRQAPVVRERPAPPLPPVPTDQTDEVTQAEAQLDNLVGNAGSATEVLDGLKQSVAEAANVENEVQVPTSSEFSHGTPYVASGASVPPLNSALLDSEPPSVRPFAEQPEFAPKAHVMIQPLNGENAADASLTNNDGFLPPPPPLPMPDQLPPDSLPPLPAMPSASDTPSTDSAMPSVDNASLGAVPPLSTMPADNVKPASPIANPSDDAGAADQFQIPGQ